MDDMWDLSSGQHTALVSLAFLQANCTNEDYEQELFSLSKDLGRAKNCNGPRIDAIDDGELETDGHLPTCLTIALDGILPSVELHSE